VATRGPCQSGRFAARLNSTPLSVLPFSDRSFSCAYGHAIVMPVWTMTTAIRPKRVGLSEKSVYRRLGILEGTSI
jgi:hypothetical protein